MSEWIEVAVRDDFKDSNIKVVTCESTTIALVLIEEGLFAIEDACPHMLAPLSEGTLEGAVILCPWHKGRFSLYTGSCLGPKSYNSAKVYSVKWEGDQVMLEWPPRKRRLPSR